MREKKGDMSMSTVVGIIIAVLAFAVLLFFIWQIGFTGRVDKETCHQSVIIRATIPSFAGLQQYGTLKCRTDKICITAGLIGGKCKEYEGSKGVTTVKVSSVSQIERLVAQNIIDCWSMMGEGKVSIFSQWVAETYGVGKVYPSCVICSRIAFDLAGLKKAKITETELANMNVENYMMTRLIPNKDVTYYEYLAGKGLAKVSIKANLAQIQKTLADEKAAAAAQTSQAGVSSEPPPKLADDQIAQQNIQGDMDSLVEGMSTGDLQTLSPTGGDVKLQAQELAIMFMQITSPTQWGSLKNIGLTLLGVGAGSMAVSPTGTVKGIKSIGGLCLKGGWVGPVVCGSIAVIAGVYQQGSVAANRAMTAGYCGDVSTGTDARNGCSVVRTVNYNMTDITQYCTVIENIA